MIIEIKDIQHRRVKSINFSIEFDESNSTIVTNDAVEHHANDAVEHHANDAVEHHANDAVEHHANDAVEHHAVERPDAMIERQHVEVPTEMQDIVF
jgi:hypothetical protein